MSAKRSSGNPGARVRTWLELDAAALRANMRTFRRMAGPRVKIWAVVKSNAYGHGLFLFSRLARQAGVDGFCVDSLIEALKLREKGFREFLLVLGPTLPGRVAEAARHRVTITVSNPESLRAMLASRRIPEFHLKVDTGMHRQGFMPEDLPTVFRHIRKHPRAAKQFKGIYTHFASPGPAHRLETARQFQRFEGALRAAESEGFLGLIRHAAATGGVLMGRRHHLDAVRVGLGLYGYNPRPGFGSKFKPVLAWRTVLTEIKTVPAGERVGYDFTRRLRRTSRLGILPVGYWHGLPRALSNRGWVLVRGRRAPILGRVSMDMTIVDITGIPAKVGDRVTLIGRDGKTELSGDVAAATAGTTAYEFLTRINPLIEKIARHARQ